MAHRSIRSGADLVIGNHKGTVQGIDYIEDVPVVYSTGQLLDGSTSSCPKEQQGILIRAEFDAASEDKTVALTVIPVLPYGHAPSSRNEYCPAVQLNEAESERVIRSVWRDTADQVINKVRFMLYDQ